MCTTNLLTHLSKFVIIIGIGRLRGGWYTSDHATNTDLGGAGLGGLAKMSRSSMSSVNCVLSVKSASPS
eukprot:151717-Prorocentrum_minimum.AAC.1